MLLEGKNKKLVKKRRENKIMFFFVCNLVLFEEDGIPEYVCK